MADSPLRLGVVGVGHLGKHHARIAAGVAGARLTAVADTQRDRAVAAAAAAGAKVFEDYRDLFGQVDAVTVAAPT